MHLINGLGRVPLRMRLRIAHDDNCAKCNKVTAVMMIERPAAQVAMQIAGCIVYSSTEASSATFLDAPWM